MRRDVIVNVPPAAATTTRGGPSEPVRKGDRWVFEDGASIPVIQGGAVTAFWYGNAFVSAFNKLIDLDGDAIKCSLHTSTYTPNQDTHDFFNDATNEVAAGGGYTAGGVTLTGVTAAASQYTGATNVWAFDAADATWAASTITARYAVVYDSTPGTAATNPLLFYVDFGADVSSTGGTFTVSWAAGGLAKVTVS